MDKETRKFLTEKFEALDTKFDKIDTKFDAIDSKFEHIQQHIDVKAVENRRHFEVVAEGLRSDIQQIAEGHQVLLDGQNRIEVRFLERVNEVERELGAMIKFSYADLDRRIHNLEDTVSTLTSRIEHIESRFK
ncbi:hypothetical protein [Nitrospira sp. M1]